MDWTGRPDINKLQLGDTVKVPLSFVKDFVEARGQVVYIHPKKRFFTVELDKSHIRESYCAYGPLS